DARRAPSVLAELEKTLNDLERQEQALRRRLAELGRRADLAGDRALVRGRAYVRRARAGILPAGEGFAAFVEHAAGLERLRRAIAADLEEQRALIIERARVAQELE